MSLSAVLTDLQVAILNGDQARPSPIGPHLAKEVLVGTRLNELANLGSVAAGAGASGIGVQDGAGFLTATTVEAALAEIAKFPAAALADPGDAAAIPVDRSATIAITTGGSGETNTLAIPTFLGQRMVLILDVDGGGDRVVTAASAINVAGNTIITLATARQNIELEAIQLAGALAWEVVRNNGTVALS